MGCLHHVGQSIHHRQYEENFTKQREPEKLFRDKYINLTPIPATTHTDFVDQLVDLTMQKKLPAIDRSVFNQDVFKEDFSEVARLENMIKKNDEQIEILQEEKNVNEGSKTASAKRI